jgi:nitrogen fixation/metabolism regulation signal transduction histidine kinase
LEAIRNNDYSFRLPADALGGAKSLQQTLNEFGKLMGEQKQAMEQHERFYEQILSSVTTGVIVLNDQNKIVQVNKAATTLFDLPVLVTISQLKKFGEETIFRIFDMQAGEKKQIQLKTSKGEIQLSIRVVKTVLNLQPVRIFILNDIRDEMEGKELESWIKLTRVLTHEVMNSLAPISSITETFLSRKDVVDSPLYEGLYAIHETSTGLINFVDSYRKFSSLQDPHPKPFYITDLLSQLHGLVIVPETIILTSLVEPEDLMVYADPNLIRQVFINLLKNAVQAIGSAEGRIHIHAYMNKDEHVFIAVSNNGPMIPDEVVEHIFVPFFTTKKEGSGIGLSLSRQIMKLSRGNISLLKSGTNGWNTTFLIEFE